jgi:hypothetical protein
MACCDIEMPVNRGLAKQAWQKMQAAIPDEDGIGHIFSDGLNISFGKNRHDTVLDSHFDICISRGYDDAPRCFILMHKTSGSFCAINDNRGSDYRSTDIDLVNDDLLKILAGETYRPAPRYIIDDGRSRTRKRIENALRKKTMPFSQSRQ